MKPITTVIVTALIVAVARFQRGESYSFEDAIIAGFLVFMLMLMGKFNQDIARAFGLLIVIGALFYQGNAKSIAKLVQGAAE